MRDDIGLSDACFQDVYRAGDALSIAYTAIFPEDKAPSADSLDREIYRRNIQLVQKNKGFVRIFHPSTSKDVTGVQVIQFDPWVELSNLEQLREDGDQRSVEELESAGILKNADKCQIVMRRTMWEHLPQVYCARESEQDSEHPVFSFDRARGGTYRYINLIIPGPKGDFEPVFLRVVDRGKSEYLHLCAGFDAGIPGVTISLVAKGDVPKALRTHPVTTPSSKKRRR